MQPRELLNSVFEGDHASPVYASQGNSTSVTTTNSLLSLTDASSGTGAASSLLDSADISAIGHSYSNLQYATGNVTPFPSQLSLNHSHGSQDITIGNTPHTPISPHLAGQTDGHYQENGQQLGSVRTHNQHGNAFQDLRQTKHNPPTSSLRNGATHGARQSHGWSPSDTGAAPLSHALQHRAHATVSHSSSTTSETHAQHVRVPSSQSGFDQPNPLLQNGQAISEPMGIKGLVVKAPAQCNKSCSLCSKDITGGSYCQTFGNIAIHQQCCMCAVCNTRPAATDAMFMQPNAVMKCFWCTSGTATTPATERDSGVVPHSTMPATTEDLQSMLMSPPLELSPTSHQHSSTHVSSSLPQHQTPQLGMSIADLWSGHTNDAEFELSPEAASPKGQTTSEGHIRTVSDSASPGLQNSERSRSDEANKERGPRTHIKPEQLSVLMNTFQRNPKPPKHVQERVAKETGLTKRVVQVWFQNKRSKEKRIRMMQRPQFSDLALYTLMSGNIHPSV
eukprot:scpid41955/ scgid3932/ LIM/homeobox protein Lhx5; Homeobox protein LIM-2 &gt; LIM/homeobox protein Lhx5